MRKLNFTTQRIEMDKYEDRMCPRDTLASRSIDVIHYNYNFNYFFVLVSNLASLCLLISCIKNVEVEEFTRVICKMEPNVMNKDNV